mgnify:FL=1
MDAPTSVRYYKPIGKRPVQRVHEFIDNTFDTEMHTKCGIIITGEKWEIGDWIVTCAECISLTRKDGILTDDDYAQICTPSQ